MIEIIYNEEGQEKKRSEPGFSLPKNIRQIGEIERSKESKGTFTKIYIEDYAVTFLNQLSSADITKPCTAILLGRVKWQDGVQYVFIGSVLEIEDMEVSNDRIMFTDRVWTYIYEEAKKYFPNQEIVGWFLSVPGYPVEITEGIFKAHVNHFGGSEKVFMMREVMEKEEGFFLFENGRLAKQPGYYIYYEKNQEMQSYMIQKNQGKSIEKTEAVPDRAIQNFRRILEDKKEENHPKPMMTFMYAASTFLVITILVIGITMINSHDKMKSMEETLASLTETLEGQGGEMQEAGSVSVESIKGDVEVLEEESESETETEVNPDITDSDTTNSESAPVDKPKQEEETQAIVENEAEIPGSYEIQMGDTLLTISKRFYGTSTRVDAICELNGIDDVDKIYPGQKIMLPK